MPRSLYCYKPAAQEAEGLSSNYLNQNVISDPLTCHFLNLIL